MAQRVRKPWYVIEIEYETIGGERKVTRTAPMRHLADATRRQLEYVSTGYRTSIREVPAPVDPEKLIKANN